MKLTKRQFCTAVKDYESMLNEETAVAAALGMVDVEWLPDKWVNTFYELLSDMCELDEDPHIGTELDWFCFTTDFGKNKDYCRIYDQETNKTWKITSPEILYDYITRND
jgi:hypothetical protein